MIRFGIIGAGSRGVGTFGRELARHSGRARLVALADVNPRRLAAGAEILGGVEFTTTDFRKLLARPDVDAVFVTTPDYTHEEIALAAFRAGKHVFCEKPLAITARACRRIIEARDKAGRILEVGFTLRYTPFFRKLKEVVSSGMLGRVFLVNAVDFYSGGATYFRRWNRLKSATGGLLIHKGTHTFDVLNWVLDSKPVRVSAVSRTDHYVADPSRGERCLTCRNRCEHYWDIDGDDTSRRMWHEPESEDGYIRDVCLFNSEKQNGDNSVAIIEYESGCKVAYMECFFCATDGRRFVMVGDKAELTGGSDSNRIEVERRFTGEKTVFTPPTGVGGHGGGDPQQVAEFLDALEAGRPSGASGEAGLISMAIGQAAELASAERRVVEIAEVLGA